MTGFCIFLLLFSPLSVRRRNGLNKNWPGNHTESAVQKYGIPTHPILCNIICTTCLAINSNPKTSQKMVSPGGRKCEGSKPARPVKIIDRKSIQSLSSWFRLSKFVSYRFSMFAWCSGVVSTNFHTLMGTMFEFAWCGSVNWRWNNKKILVEEIYATKTDLDDQFSRWPVLPLWWKLRYSIRRSSLCCPFPLHNPLVYTGSYLHPYWPTSFHFKWNLHSTKSQDFKWTTVPQLM